MKILVCGGRDYQNSYTLFNVLDNIQGTSRTRMGFDCIISGHAPGADLLAESYANIHGIKLEVYPADWEKYGKVAGPIRNKQMLEEGKPDLVVAFPGGRGTLNMINTAKEFGVEVLKVKDRQWL